MKKIFEGIKNNPLFKGISVADFEAMISCVQGKLQVYQKGEIIQLVGNPVEMIGLVVSGGVQVVRDDIEGKQNLMADLREGSLFGEVFACAGILNSPVTVISVEKSEILHINYSKIITICSSACSFHSKLIENMLELIAHKNLLLNQKIEILSKRTIRERLLCYFDLYHNGARKFTISLSREKLASYICVDRSAMSAELSKMQREGLILYKGNSFEIM